ncbi:amidohydrolase family protein [Flavihumibacter solisilvae]|uniref:Amidohydrolase n=1 Tax=Flavihumibacter solisilvae TaxID=1349421 RepID=A0A0C1L6J6_9BACT|nr:amidohydrolase family protein [Flavihumibacter solisilvae]KIC95762.1 amidohydrolase [Flavihumibacter solisilvae]
MKKLIFLLAAIFVSVDNFGQTYIQNVTVVDVINQKLIPGQTVLIGENTISDIKPTKKVKIPNNATVINGEGKFLIPGMTDAHVHFSQSGGLYTRPDAFDLRKYVSYEQEIAWTKSNLSDFLNRYIKTGITTVIDVGATYNFLSLRDSLSQKTNTPKVYMTGPLLTTYKPEVFKSSEEDEPFKLVTTINDAKKLVAEQLLYHPDFIKIWYIVQPDSTGLEAAAKKLEPIVKTIIEEAHKYNLKVAVHATERITAQIAVQNGCDFLVHNIEDEVVSDEFVKLLKSKNIVLSPTMTVQNNYFKPFEDKISYDAYDLENANPKTIGSIYDFKHLSDTSFVQKYVSLLHSQKFTAYFSRMDSIKAVNLKKIADGGVTIAAGTDAGNIGTQHATSFISELRVMKASGLSNWQVLQSATINPANIFNNIKSSGSISIGKIADLVLLDANPIEDLNNLTQVSLVFKNGKAIKPETVVVSTPESLVQQQLNAYNARDINAFLEPYADDAEIYIFPDKLLGKGKEIIRKQYTALFDGSPDLHCTIRGRIIKGNTVIDHESVTGARQPEKLEAIAIYEIKDGKIVKVYFIQ